MKNYGYFLSSDALEMQKVWPNIEKLTFEIKRVF